LTAVTLMYFWIMENLKIITSTTRQGNKGIAIANWITELAKTDDRFNTELIGLADFDLPLMDEPNHPRLQQYQNESTKKWSEVIGGADAFIIVLAEYNHSFPAPIKNALDHLYKEWNHKPVAFVSYGGLSAGLRSLHTLKPVLNALNMVPVLESVAIPFFTKFINDEEEFVPDESIVKSAHVMLNELNRWSQALKPMRG